MKLYSLVYDEKANRFTIVLTKIAKAHDWLTIISTHNTYRQAEQAKGAAKGA